MYHNVIFQHSSLVKLAKYNDCSLPPDEVASPFPGTFTHISFVVFQVNLKFMKREICTHQCSWFSLYFSFQCTSIFTKQVLTGTGTAQLRRFRFQTARGSTLTKICVNSSCSWNFSTSYFSELSPSMNILFTEVCSFSNLKYGIQNILTMITKKKRVHSCNKVTHT